MIQDVRAMKYAIIIMYSIHARLFMSKILIEEKIYHIENFINQQIQLLFLL